MLRSIPHLSIYVLFLSPFFLAGCATISEQSRMPGLFADRMILGKVELDVLNEISGLAVSQKSQNVLWVHNDSGDKSNVYAMRDSGEHLATYFIEGCWAFDWEDIALGPGPEASVSYLYVGDIGDNLAVRPYIQICRVVEPQLAQSRQNISTLKGEVITLYYPGGPRDAESLMIDSITKDLYVVSKRESNVSVYRAPYPQSLTELNLLEQVAILPLTGITAGDISQDGLEVLLKTMRKVYYWHRDRNESLAVMFQRPPIEIPSYEREPQGEAIGWDKSGQGFFTISEELMGIDAKVNYYPRIKAHSKVDTNVF